MSYQQNNFQPKPRPVLDPEHELNPIAESIIANKRELKPHHTPGAQPSTNQVMMAGAPYPVPMAALVISHQMGVPFNHPNLPPAGKLNSNFPSSDYFLEYGKMTGPMKWEKDETFRYIPCFTRYVINEAGTIKNASNGKLVAESVFGGALKLVSDGPINGPYWADGSLLQLLAFTKLPEDFVDYGFKNYSHRIGVKDSQPAWVPLPMVSARSNVDGTITKCKNVREFIITCIKDFGQRKEAYPLIKVMTETKAVRMGEYNVMYGDHNDREAFGPANPDSGAQQQAAPQPMAANTSFDDQLSF